MENVTYKAVFHEHGFEVGKDVSEAELEQLRSMYMIMYDLFTTFVNQGIEMINDAWEKYIYIKERGDAFATHTLQCEMKINSDTTYADWVEKWYKEYAHVVDSVFMQAPLKSRIFRDGENVVYGVAFKEHPEWTMDFTIEQV